MRYLGLDLGSKTLGMAISDASATIASSYQILRHDEDYESLIPKIKQVIIDKQIDKIVLGFPKNMNNTVGPKGELSIWFKKLLEDNLNIEVILEDERLTTTQAQNLLIKNNCSRKKRKKVIDAMAATIILQSYIDRRKN